MQTKSKQEVKSIEELRFQKKQLPRPKEFFMISLFVFTAASFTDYAYKNDLIKKK
jgi:hypothetical protein